MFRFASLILAAIILLICAVSVFFLWDYKQALRNTIETAGEQIFSIEQGQGLKEIALNLQKSGIISSALYFQAYSWQKGWQGAYQAGEYIFNGKRTIKDVAYMIASGEGINREYKVLIKEGEDLADLAKKFAELGMFSEEDFFAAAGYPKADYGTAQNYPQPKDYSQKYSFLDDKPKHVSYEGYLFPDTYRFFKDSTPDGVILKMLDNFNQKLGKEMRAEIAGEGKSIYEIITMASLLEKEVRTEEDMKVVSGIFWDRIKIGQPLQSCATLAYILGEMKAQYSLEDTNIDSSYNTYRNKGLPPGPIGNPGLKAIRAAIYPTYTDYNYFLSAPDGTTVFAKTFEEHVRNKDKYLE